MGERRSSRVRVKGKGIRGEERRESESGWKKKKSGGDEKREKARQRK